MCKRASVGVSVAKITLISYRGGIMNVLWAGWVVFQKQFVSVESLCNDGVYAQNQQGRHWFHLTCAERQTRDWVIFAFSFICTCVFWISTYVCIKVCKCPNGGGRSERALLLPRVYLQTATLMWCNDYFYSRYFGSPFALSRMTPHWPADYLWGCRHTWLLQISSLFPTLHLQNLPFLLLHLHLFISLSLYRSFS